MKIIDDTIGESLFFEFGNDGLVCSYVLVNNWYSSCVLFDEVGSRRLFYTRLYGKDLRELG